jgi:hypothetical protein
VGPTLDEREEPGFALLKQGGLAWSCEAAKKPAGGGPMMCPSKQANAQLPGTDLLFKQPITMVSFPNNK